jgi:hypothetical protein
MRPDFAAGFIDQLPPFARQRQDAPSLISRWLYLQKTHFDQKRRRPRCRWLRDPDGFGKFAN